MGERLHIAQDCAVLFVLVCEKAQLVSPGVNLMPHRIQASSPFGQRLRSVPICPALPLQQVGLLSRDFLAHALQLCDLLREPRNLILERQDASHERRPQAA